MNFKISTLAMLFAANQAWGLKVKEDVNENAIDLSNQVNPDDFASQGQCRSKYCTGFYRKRACGKCNDNQGGPPSESDECDAILSNGYKSLYVSSSASADPTALDTLNNNLRSIEGWVGAEQKNIAVGE
jgi:hypothetical protein